MEIDPCKHNLDCCQWEIVKALKRRVAPALFSLESIAHTPTATRRGIAWPQNAPRQQNHTCRDDPSFTQRIGSWPTSSTIRHEEWTSA
uniref:Uncharacterized protein n=1 Tax=Ascaris lumbricoides TaxID=6252 RepID=A0A0M3HQ41_ASCLU